MHRKCVYGFVDEDFREVIPLQFTYAYNFSEGLAAVKTTDGKWGYLNKKGEFVIEPKYLRAENFRDGMAQVEFQSLPDSTIWQALIDHDGRELYSVAVGPDAHIHRNGQFVIIAETYENQTVLDANGQVVLRHCTCVYDNHSGVGIQYFCEGKAGLLLPNGSKRPADSLFELQKISAGLTGVSFCQTWGLRDSTGQWLIPLGEMSNGGPTEDGKYFTVWRNGQAGLYDRQGRLLIPAEYDQIFRLDDYWQVSKNGLLGLFDAQGRLVVPPKYAQVEPFATVGLVKVTLSDGKVGFYDFRGRGYFSE